MEIFESKDRHTVYIDIYVCKKVMVMVWEKKINDNLTQQFLFPHLILSSLLMIVPQKIADNNKNLRQTAYKKRSVLSKHFS